MARDHPQVTAFDHLVLTVRDIAATVRFYESALGMRAETFHPADGSVRIALAFGSQKINLHPAEAPFAPHADDPAPGTADLCFLSEQDLTAWQTHFDGLGITVVAGPVARTGATGPIRSLYVRDPDGNLIEIANRA